MSPRIVSVANPRIKELVRLRSRRERDRTGRFLIEGYRELRRALAAGVAVGELYTCPDLFLGDNEGDLMDRARSAGARLVDVSEAVFRRASYRDRPEGLLGVARQFDTTLEHVAIGHVPLLLVVESIEKPGNLGTMLRTAEAAGADAVIVCDPTTDVFNPNVVRASIGALFLLPIAVTTTPDAIAWLSQHDIASYAATPAASLLYTERDLTGACALIVGSEQLGLSDTWLESSTHRIRIPMRGDADSLNAAMAAGILLFEAVRQRGRH